MIPDYILFFKLYFLAHHRCFINYFEEAILLRGWLCTEELELDVEKSQPMPAICSGCFQVTRKGFNTFTFSCSSCHELGTIGYEIQQLSQILRIDFKQTLYLMLVSLHEIYKEGNDVRVMRGILYGK